MTCLVKLLWTGTHSSPGTFLQQHCDTLKRLKLLPAVLPFSFTDYVKSVYFSVGSMDFSSESTFRRILWWPWPQVSHTYSLHLLNSKHTVSRGCCYTNSGLGHTAPPLLVTTEYPKSLVHSSSPWDQPTARMKPWVVFPHQVLRRQHGNQALTPAVHELATGIGILPHQEACSWWPVTSTACVTIISVSTSHWKAAQHAGFLGVSFQK